MINTPLCIETVSMTAMQRARWHGLGSSFCQLISIFWRQTRPARTTCPALTGGEPGTMWPAMSAGRGAAPRDPDTPSKGAGRLSASLEGEHEHEVEKLVGRGGVIVRESHVQGVTSTV